MALLSTQSRAGEDSVLGSIGENMKKLFLLATLLLSLSSIVHAESLYKQLDGKWTSDIMDITFDTKYEVWGGLFLKVDYFVRKLEFVSEDQNDKSVQLKSNGKPFTVRFLPNDGGILLTQEGKLPLTLKREKE